MLYKLTLQSVPFCEPLQWSILRSVWILKSQRIFAFSFLTNGLRIGVIPSVTHFNSVLITKIPMYHHANFIVPPNLQCNVFGQAFRIQLVHGQRFPQLSHTSCTEAWCLAYQCTFSSSSFAMPDIERHPYHPFCLHLYLNQPLPTFCCLDVIHYYWPRNTEPRSGLYIAI